MTFCDGGVAALHHLGLRGSGVAIGHLDTGVDGAHPALDRRVAAFRMFENTGFTSRAAAATDTIGHGTHTAGVMVGEAHGEPHSGTAPEAVVHAGAVIEDGAVVARMLLGLDWLAGQPVSVVNLSIGVPAPAPVFRPLLRELARRDVVVIAAIGNGGPGVAYAPGDCPEVLSVGAIDSGGAIATFSGSVHCTVDHSRSKPDVVAVGVGVVSTATGGGSTAMSGTSVASARVAGMVALLRQAEPTARANDVSAAIVASAGPVSDAQHRRVRAGEVCIHRALRLLQTHTKPAGEPPRTSPDATLPTNEGPMLDRRLSRKLSLGGERAVHDAALAFSGVEAMHRALNAHDPVRLTTLESTPTCILRAPTSALRHLLDAPGLLAASATDVDRARLLC